MPDFHNPYNFIPTMAPGPAGKYDIVIGLYQYPSFERLKIDGSDATEYTISRVTINP